MSEIRTRRARPSFREKVRASLIESGIHGASLDTLYRKFRDYPRTKVTVALNELISRKEVYLRNGIYRIYRLMAVTGSAAMYVSA